MKTDTFFNAYYNNAKTNSILIMNCEGVILDVNHAFTNNYGYNNEDVRGQNFSILFNANDRQNKLPELELLTVAAKGQANDENYVINKQGQPVLSLGESILVSDSEGVYFIVKDIVNLQAKRHIDFFLTETEELLERIYESSKDMPMIILDGSLKVLKANKPFLDLFEIAEEPIKGSRLANLSHSFWENGDMRREISSIIINNLPLRNRKFVLKTKAGGKKLLRFNSRIIESKTAMQRKIFITIEDLIE